jgi:hypothetical protein
MHASVLRFVASNLQRNEVEGKRVLEVGSADVNGSVRPMVMALGPSTYLGIDLAEGPGVDRILDISGCSGLERQEVRSEVLISTEMLEHAEFWQQALRNMVEACTETLILTCRGPGFPRHNPPDHHRFTVSDLVRAISSMGMTILRAEEDPQVPGVFIKACHPGLISVAKAPEW